MWQNLFNGNTLIGWVVTAILACGVGVLIGRFRPIARKTAVALEDIAQLVMQFLDDTEDSKVTAEEVAGWRAKFEEIIGDLKVKNQQVYDRALYKFAMRSAAKKMR